MVMVSALPPPPDLLNELISGTKLRGGGIPETRGGDYGIKKATLPSCLAENC